MLFDTVEERGDFGDVVWGGADDFWMFSCAEGNAHGVFVMLLKFGLDEEAGCVDLRDPPGGMVVSVDGVIWVVEDDDGGFGHY